MFEGPSAGPSDHIGRCLPCVMHCLRLRDSVRDDQTLVLCFKSLRGKQRSRWHNQNRGRAKAVGCWGEGRGGTEPALDEMTKGQNQSKEAERDSPGRQKSMSKGPEARHSCCRIASWERTRCQASGCPEWSGRGQSKGKLNVLVLSMALTIEKLASRGAMSLSCVSGSTFLWECWGGTGSNEGWDARSGDPNGSLWYLDICILFQGLS